VLASLTLGVYAVGQNRDPVQHFYNDIHNGLDQFSFNNNVATATRCHEAK